MKVSEADILIIPGWGNSGPEHWQSRWQAKLSSARRVEQTDWDAPASRPWVDAAVAAIDAAEKPVVLVAHSLGVPTAIAAAGKARGRIVGGFFVAPPDLEPTGSVPPELREFGPYPRAPLPFPSIVIASSNDPYGSLEHAGDIANAWGSLFIDARESGHINSDSGHGPWPEGTMVFAQFLSRLKA
jgi:predicted alpha/beta hydrolase family esterase